MSGTVLSGKTCYMILCILILRPLCPADGSNCKATDGIFFSWFFKAGFLCPGTLDHAALSVGITMPSRNNFVGCFLLVFTLLPYWQHDKRQVNDRLSQPQTSTSCPGIVSKFLARERVENLVCE